MDDVSVGCPHLGADGQMHDSMSVKGQVFGLMTKESLLDDSFDCICGLAYPSMANYRDVDALPLFDTMMKQKLLN